jgi:hypothetical protein
MRRLKTLASALMIAIVVIAALDYTASAATGGKFILGHLNKAGKQTVLKRTKSGAALGLTTKSSASAPITTNARGKVTNLNSDLLDGLDSSSFARAGAYAAVAANGTLNPSDGQGPIGGSASGLTASNVTAHTVTGTYCFHPSFAPKSAMVSAIGDFGASTSSFIVATVTVRTNHQLSNCDTNDTVRVRTFAIPADPGSPALSDQAFILWLK